METLQNMERDTEKAAPGKGRRRRRKRASLLGEDIGIQADFFRFPRNVRTPYLILRVYPLKRNKEYSLRLS